MITRDDSGIHTRNTTNESYCECCNICCIHKPRKISNDDLSHLGTERSTFCLKFSWFLVGIGFLFPYNSVVTAVDFFASIYFRSIDFSLGWLLLAPSVIILITTLKFGYWGTIYQRIIGTFLLEAILTIIIPLVRNVYVVFIGTFILGCLSAVLQGTLFSLLGFLGSDMMSITQTGIGLGGVLVGIVRIFTKIFIPTDIRDSTYLYFLLAFIMVVIDVAIYIFILHPSRRVQIAIYQDTMKNQSLHAMKGNNNNNNNKSVTPKGSKRTMQYNESTVILDDQQNKNNYNACNRNPCVVSHDNQSIMTESGEEKTKDMNTTSDVSIQNEDNSPLSLGGLFCASWRCQIAVFLNYVITLALFPGVISLMQWDNNNDEWFAVIQIFLFNLFDTIGKNLVTYPCILNLWSHNGLLIVSICRFAFIPLFVMCVKPLIFSWQIAIIINGLMGITNGWVGTSGFCLGPLSPNVPKHEKGRTSQMIAVALTSGLVVGSSSAFLINFVMTNYL